MKEKYKLSEIVQKRLEENNLKMIRLILTS